MESEPADLRFLVDLGEGPRRDLTEKVWSCLEGVGVMAGPTRKPSRRGRVTVQVAEEAILSEAGVYRPRAWTFPEEMSQAAREEFLGKLTQPGVRRRELFDRLPR